ncbi:MAG TPA: hypothetical protein V6D06_04390 [Trichocoleus sp.]
MQYLDLLTISARSAASTVRICYRKSCKDSLIIYRAATSPQARQFYAFLGRMVLVAMGLAVMAGMFARSRWDLWSGQIDTYIQSCQQPAAAAPPLPEATQAPSEAEAPQTAQPEVAQAPSEAKKPKSPRAKARKTGDAARPPAKKSPAASKSRKSPAKSPAAGKRRSLGDGGAALAPS